MDTAQKQLNEKLQAANHILVTVSRNPSVDQLSACIGLTLILNKLGKQATAVFSGQIPSTIEFLQPEETLEKTTDSLRDFIIALDKSKADKLRYKVEDDVVRIFITPYKTSISEADLNFSQGDFNVEVVVALGVHQQEDLDEAITAHGRILHDATVASINLDGESGLGSLLWNDPHASSLSELVTELSQSLGENLLDAQIATALLTGIVAETGRFGNEKTSPQTMNLSAMLMSAGANQQLVASKLEEPIANTDAMNEPAPLDPVDSEHHDEPAPEEHHDEPEAKIAEVDDGTLDIVHTDAQPTPPSEEVMLPEPVETPEPQTPEEPPVVETPKISEPEPTEPQSEAAKREPVAPQRASTENKVSTGDPFMDHPPVHGAVFTANTEPEAEDTILDPLSPPARNNDALLSHDAPAPSEETKQPEHVIAGMTPPPPAWVPPSSNPLESKDDTPSSAHPDTLAELEVALQSPHVTAEAVDSARDEVSKALSQTEDAPAAIQALNAQPLGESLHPTTSLDMPIPAPAPAEPPTDKPSDPNAPPPVPPPIPFQFGSPPPSQ